MLNGTLFVNKTRTPKCLFSIILSFSRTLQCQPYKLKHNLFMNFNENQLLFNIYQQHSSCLETAEVTYAK